MLSPTIIFDLDNCLFDTASTKKGLVPIFEDILRKHGYEESQVHSLVEAIWAMPLTEVFAQHELSQSVMNELRDVHPHLPVPEATQKYDDVIDVLTDLRSKNVSLFLVSKGFAKFQERKVAFLGIGEFFKSMIFVGEGSEHERKLSAFQHLIETENLDTKTLFVVGDSSDELTAGKEVGATAIQILRPGVIEKTADHHINSLTELSAILFSK